MSVPAKSRRLDSRLVACRKAAELLAESFDPNSTIADLLRILPRPPAEPAPVGPPAPARPATPPAGSHQAFSLTPPEARDTRHKEMIAAFVMLWRERRGGEYRTIGGRDGAALRDLLRAIPDLSVAEFRRRAAFALTDPWFRKAGHLAALCYDWSKWEPPRAPVAQASGYKLFAGYDEHGQPIYRERA